jgi:Cysteine-rich CPCC
VHIGTPLKDIGAPPSKGGGDHFVNVRGLPGPDIFYHCPCCYYPTLETRGSFEICAVCYWEDDGQDDQDSDRVRGGPNGHLSLLEARKSFSAFGACEQAMIEHVRAPTEIEKSFRKHVV